MLNKISFVVFNREVVLLQEKLSTFNSYVVRSVVFYVSLFFSNLRLFVAPARCQRDSKHFYELLKCLLSSWMFRFQMAMRKTKWLMAK